MEAVKVTLTGRHACPFTALLLGKGMEFVAEFNTFLMNPATRGGFSFFTSAVWQTGS